MNLILVYFNLRASDESTSLIYIVLVVIRIPPVATDILITLSTDTLSLDHLNSSYFTTHNIGGSSDEISVFSTLSSSRTNFSLDSTTPLVKSPADIFRESLDSFKISNWSLFV